jgi:hypothetical protein
MDLLRLEEGDGLVSFHLIGELDLANVPDMTARLREELLRADQLTLDIKHPRWPMRPARVIRLENDLVASNGLPEPEAAPRVHLSPGVPARLGFPRRPLPGERKRAHAGPQRAPTKTLRAKNVRPSSRVSTQAC